MDANLVCAPREQLAIDQRVAIVVLARFEALEHAERGDGVAGGRHIAHGHARSLVGASRDGRVDHTRVRCNHAVNKREVVAIDRAIANILHKSIASRIGLRCEHKPRRVTIEPVHNTEAVVLALHVAKVVGPAVVDESVHERPIGMVDRRMAHEPDLLRQYDKVIVLEADVKVDWLSCYRARLNFFLFLIHDHVACSDCVLLGNVGPVHEDVTRLDCPRGGTAARKARTRGEQRVEPLPRIERRGGITQHTRHLFPTPIFASTHRALRLGALMDEKRHDE